MPKLEKKKSVEVKKPKVDPSDYSDYSEYLAAKKKAGEK